MVEHYRRQLRTIPELHRFNERKVKEGVEGSQPQ